MNLISYILNRIENALKKIRFIFTIIFYLRIPRLLNILNAIYNWKWKKNGNLHNNNRISTKDSNTEGRGLIMIVRQ